MKKSIKIFIIFITSLTLISVLILKLNIHNLAYQAVFFTNKAVSISDIKVNNEPVYKQYVTDKKRIYPVTINTLYKTKIQLGKQTRYIKVNSLKKDKYININIISFKNKKLNRTNYHLQLLHQNFSELNIENKGINKGYIFANYTNAQDFPAHVFIMDTKGNIVFFRTNKNPNYSVFNLQKWKTKNNGIFYSLHQPSNENTDRYEGQIVVLDKHFNVIDEVKTLSTSKHPELEADEHDFILLNKYHYIVESFWEKQFTKNSHTFSYIDCVIQEIKDKKVIFDWVASEHKNFVDNNFVIKNTIFKNSDIVFDVPILLDESFETRINKNNKNSELINDNYKKCVSRGECEEFHINSLAIDPLDNNLIVSFKYKNSVVKIDRRTGEILWQLGGLHDEFNLSKDEKFKFQHHTHFEQDDILYVFDNLSHNPSRIIKYQFDKEHKNVIKKEFINLNDFVYAMGSVQMINNNKMIVSYGNGLKYAIKIMDLKGDTYWSAKFDDKLIKYKKTIPVPYNAIYRAYYYETLN